MFQSNESVLIIFATRSHADRRMRECWKETNEKQEKCIQERKIKKKKEKKRLYYCVNELHSCLVYIAWEMEFYGQKSTVGFGVCYCVCLFRLLKTDCLI